MLNRENLERVEESAAPPKPRTHFGVTRDDFIDRHISAGWEPWEAEREWLEVNKDWIDSRCQELEVGGE
jgi:hypothetical protein